MNNKDRENDKTSSIEIEIEIDNLLDLLNIELCNYQKLYIKSLLEELRMIENEE